MARTVVRRARMLLCLAPLVLPRSASAALVDSSFVETTHAYVTSGITGIAWAPDASRRLFVTIKSGSVRIVKNGVLLATPFSTDTVITNGECGLIGLALDPAFATNGWVYLFETVSTTEQQIVRYTATGDVGTDRLVVKGGLPTRGANHDGGGLAFGPDGMLYFGIGDLAEGVGVDADLGSLASKIGRIDRSGATPVDNPFHDGSGPNDDAIWARGHRNPFAITFHPVTGGLWVDDAGAGYEKIFHVGRGDHAGFNDHEINQPSGYLRPTIHYRTNSSETQTIGATGASRASNVATFTLTSSARVHKGQRITIAGVADPTFDTVAYVRSVPASNSFTIDQAGPNATSGGGTVVTTDLGGAITGGIFYDGTQFPASHRGNLFFGDFNSGNLMRATLAGDQTANSVDVWGSDFGTFIDADVGPDGALYLVRYGGNVVRIRHSATAQALVLSKTNVRTSEAGATAFGVSLAIVPASDVTVAVVRASGDTDVTASPSALTFTTTNWNVPQFVTIAAAADADATDDVASFELSSAGLATERVTARVNDDDGAPGLITSVPYVAVGEGGSNTFTVRLSAAPTGSVDVAIAASGDPDVTVSPPTLSFGADWATPKTVTVQAAQDPDSTHDLATIDVSAAGLASRSVVVSVADDELVAPRITSTPVRSAAVSALYTYDVDATGAPAPAYALSSTVPGMTIDRTTGVITWTPTTAGPVEVTARAMNGVSPDSTQTFTITVAGVAGDASTSDAASGSDVSSEASVPDASLPDASGSDAPPDASFADSATDAIVADTLTSDSAPADSASDAEKMDSGASVEAPAAAEEGGCGCRAASGASSPPSLALVALAALIDRRARRRRLAT